MPMYEYLCKTCNHQFETLVVGSRKPVCPKCQSQELEKQFSTFGMGGNSTYGYGSASAGGSCSSGGG